MDTHFTARKFRARAELKTYALGAVQKLDKFYDGIVRADIILSFERTTKSVKKAEINLHVHGSVLSAQEGSEEFHKSIDLAIEKLERQLDKYKTKLRLKNKRTLRKVKERATSPARGEGE
jgi:putative sigma-54 modulation protein